MKKDPRPPVDPDWRELLGLGEELLDYHTASSQAQFFQRIVSQRLSAGCEVWFASPFYPLPGDPIMATLPDPGAPELAALAFEKRQILMEADGEILPLKPQNHPRRVAFPLKTAEDLLGVLIAQREPGFSAKELDFLEGFCAHSAVALQVVRQAVIKNWRFEQLALVRSVSQKIQNQRDLDALCRQITRLIRDTFHIYFVSIFTVDPETGKIRFRASSGATDSSGEEVQFSVEPGQGIIGTVAQSGNEIIVSDVRSDPLLLVWRRPREGRCGLGQFSGHRCWPRCRCGQADSKQED